MIIIRGCANHHKWQSGETKSSERCRDSVFSLEPRHNGSYQWVGTWSLTPSLICCKEPQKEGWIDTGRTWQFMKFLDAWRWHGSSWVVSLTVLWFLSCFSKTVLWFGLCLLTSCCACWWLVRWKLTEACNWTCSLQVSRNNHPRWLWMTQTAPDHTIQPFQFLFW